jgi:hypothetical protein
MKKFKSPSDAESMDSADHLKNESVLNEQEEALDGTSSCGEEATPVIEHSEKAILVALIGKEAAMKHLQKHKEHAAADQGDVHHNSLVNIPDLFPQAISAAKKPRQQDNAGESESPMDHFDNH